MVTFKSSHTTVTMTIGDSLRLRRREHKLSMQAVSRILLIPVKHILHMENDQFFAISEKLYRELFLKSYATYLGLEWSAVKTQYDAQHCVYSAQGVGLRSAARPVRARQLIVAPQLIKTLCLSLVVCGCFTYLLFLGYRAISPPPLIVASPLQDEVSVTGRIVVKGMTSEQARVTINGEQVAIKPDGGFEQDIVLSEGMNVVTIGASKKYSKERSEERRVVYRREHARSQDSLLIKSN